MIEVCLKYKSCTLCLLLTSKLKVLASFQGQLCFRPAIDTLQSDADLLCRLCLLVKDWLGLATISPHLSIVPALSQGNQRRFSSLVLSDSVLSVLLATLSLAVRPPCLGNIDHLAGVVYLVSRGVDWG